MNPRMAVEGLWSQDQLNAHLPLEVPQTVRLYLDGKIAQ
jgi:hypothetical protein